MNKIEIALEKAKRNGTKGKATPSFSRSPSHETIPERIVYTRTRSVEPPLSHLREQRIVAAFEEGPFTNAYKILRTQVAHRMRENGWNTLGVTSSAKGEGKTVTTANLAISLAMEPGQTVLLVDTDLSSPSIHRALGIGEGRGLSDYLIDDIPIEDLLIHPGVGRLILLPGGRRVSNSTDQLTSPKMISLVEEMKGRYSSRTILFDLPPLSRSADVLAFAPHLDALLLVVEAGSAKREEVEGALRLLREFPLIGAVLNKG